MTSRVVYVIRGRCRGLASLFCSNGHGQRQEVRRKGGVRGRGRVRGSARSDSDEDERQTAKGERRG